MGLIFTDPTDQHTLWIFCRLRPMAIENGDLSVELVESLHEFFFCGDIYKVYSYLAPSFKTNLY